jgi:3-deoxy-D-manno-octulosonic-acid transferase
LIIAPHEINTSSIEQLSKRISETKKKLSQQLFTKGIQFIETDIIIIDTIGVLSSVYQYADIAIIGGGFGSGIHNTTEALVYGMPVAFGPNYKKFKEAIESIELKFGFCFTNENELHDILINFIQNPDLLNQLKSKAKNYIHQNSGSTDKIMKYLVDHDFLN